MHRRSRATSFASLVWSDDVAKTPTTGQTVVFIVDLCHPQRSALDVQPFSQARLTPGTKYMLAVGRHGQLHGKDRERLGKSPPTWGFLPLFPVRNVSVRTPHTIRESRYFASLLRSKNAT